MSNISDQQVRDYRDLQSRLRVLDAPTDDQLARMDTLTSRARYLAEELTLRIQPGRARSLAITKLEECFMWALEAIMDERGPDAPEPLAWPVTVTPDKGTVGSSDSMGGQATTYMCSVPGCGFGTYAPDILAQHKAQEQHG